MIHSTAVVSTNANIAKNVNIGPYCVIDQNVTIDEGCVLSSHVNITGNTNIGKNNKFFPFTSIGSMPQDLKYAGELSNVVIGDNNTFRESVTVNPGTLGGGMITKIDNNCLFMVGVHIAHDCYISSNVVMANNATLAGHVSIGENAIIGGLSAIHQFVSIGKYAMIGGMSGVESNIVPYGLYLGIRGNLRGLNLIGLKRKGVDKKNIVLIQKAFKNIFNTENPIEINIEKISNEELSIIEIKEMINFIKVHIKRGICNI